MQLCPCVHRIVDAAVAATERKKTASGSILQTILSRALVEVEFRLYDSCQTCYPKMGPGEAPPCVSSNAWSHHFRNNPTYFRVMVDIVLAIVFRCEGFDSVCPWPLLRISPRSSPWNRLQHCIALRKLSRPKPAENMRVQGRPHLRLCTSGNTLIRNYGYMLIMGV